MSAYGQPIAGMDSGQAACYHKHSGLWRSWLAYMSGGHGVGGSSPPSPIPLQGMLNIRERKRALRAALRGRATEAGIETEAAGLIARLQCSDLWRHHDTFLCYFPLPDEIDSRLLIRLALGEGKRIALPRIEGTRLDFRLLPDGGLLPDRSKRLFQPPRDWPLLHLPVHPSFHRALLIVPGLAFDRHGNRLGRGGGYYDRFLASWGSSMTSVALCQSWRLLTDLPLEPHDCHVDAIVSSNYYKHHEDITNNCRTIAEVYGR